MLSNSIFRAVGVAARRGCQNKECHLEKTVAGTVVTVLAECVLNQDCDPFCLLLLRTVVVVVVVFAPSACESRLIQCSFCKFTVILRYIFVFR